VRLAPARFQPARIFRLALALSLTVSAGLFFVWSRRWPLVGDASLIHYIAFLIERGWAPYRELGDVNMPGSYLIELAAMQLFGYGDRAWRLFDFTLLIAASISFFVVCRRSEPPARQPSPAALPRWLTPGRLAAIFSASLFILAHGRDGLAQGGQRDLTMAVCLVAATAFLFIGVRRSSPLSAAAFGLLSGIAFTIKPTILPLTIAQLALALYALRPSAAGATPLPASAKTTNARPRISPIQFAASAILAYLLAPAIAIGFLLSERALSAFLTGLHTIVPYYAGLGHRPVGFVLVHSLSTLHPLLIVWLAVLALGPAHIRWSRDWQRNTLVAGALFGLLNCLVQQRALPYYRYPLLAFLFPLIAIDLTPLLWPSSRWRTAPRHTQAATVLAFLGLGYAGFVLAPRSAYLIHGYQWQRTDFIASLQQDLTSLGGPALSGHIQCIDSISGCGDVLYRMRLEPSTGVLSDFLLFGNPSDRQPPEDIAIIRQTRGEFSAAVLAHPPQVIVVSSHLHIDGPDDYLKLRRWPAFAAFLADRYTLATQWSPSRTARWWSREETPASYRIYVLRAPPDGPAPPHP
jgi:hypothetical protein